MHYCFSSVGSWQGNASQLRIRELGRELLVRNHQVSYILDDVPFNREQANLPSGASACFIKTIPVMDQFSERQDIIHRIAPDFFHVLNPSPKSVVTCHKLKMSIKLVADYDEWTGRQNRGWFRNVAFKYIDGWFRKHACLICVSSQYMRDRFAAEYQAASLYLPYATYVHQQPVVPNPFTELAFVYVGSFFEQYDHEILFHAALELKKRGHTPLIEFLGQGPQLKQWNQFVLKHALTNINIRGYVSDEELWARVSHANVLLFPIRPTVCNLSRCPSKTYLYAQARRPIITCAVGEVPTVLGQNAIYVKPTANAFVNAMQQRMSHAQDPVDYQIEQHNWSKRTDTLLEALQPLL